jgi:hypothetical protein
MNEANDLFIGSTNVDKNLNKLEHILNIYACKYMKKLNKVARSNEIPVKSNDGGIRLEGMVMFVQSTVKMDVVARSIGIPLKSNNKWWG